MISARAKTGPTKVDAVHKLCEAAMATAKDEVNLVAHDAQVADDVGS